MSRKIIARAVKDRISRGRQTAKDTGAGVRGRLMRGRDTVKVNKRIYCSHVPMRNTRLGGRSNDNDVLNTSLNIGKTQATGDLFFLLTKARHGQTKTLCSNAYVLSTSRTPI